MVDCLLCTGCSACANACPQGCIHMIADENGFQKPHKYGANCTDCGICERVCPLTKSIARHDTPQCFAANIEDEEVRKNSSSGGVFSAIAAVVLEDGGVVYGAALTENMQVAHRAAETEMELEKLRGSKYVQSELNACFSEIKKHLIAGKNVLFVGTPCQTAGLLSYLGKPYDTLVTADIICHGVPSPKAWEAYLKVREQEANAKVVYASFRDKTYGWNQFSMCLKFDNGAEYRKPLTEDPYLRGFLANLFLNSACSDCRFKGIHRSSDITIADFWGLSEVLPEYANDKGTSLVLVHSAKGQRLIAQAKKSLHLTPAQPEQALNHNTAAEHSVEPHRNRERFFRRLHAGASFDAAVNVCLKRSVVRRVCGKIKRMIWRNK